LPSFCTRPASARPLNPRRDDIRTSSDRRTRRFISWRLWVCKVVALCRAPTFQKHQFSREGLLNIARDPLAGWIGACEPINNNDIPPRNPPDCGRSTWLAAAVSACFSCSSPPPPPPPPLLLRTRRRALCKGFVGGGGDVKV
jgi:hypothetical protein